MATTTTTPDKVKNLLTSFLVKPSQIKGNTDSQDAPSPPTIRDRSTDVQEKDVTSRSTLSSSALRSYEKFLQRLDSFSSVTWFGKPVELSPLVCSRYGWENVDTDMLLCVGCKSFLSGHLPDKVDIAAYETSLSKLKEGLLTAHDKFCVLAANPCPEHFCHVACHDPASLTAGFVVRATALGKVQDRLPCVDFKKFNQLGYDEGQGGAYCKRHLMPDQEFSLETVTLAFTGWTVDPSSPDVLQCTMCRRKVGLWNFNPRSPNARFPDSTSQDEEEEEDTNENGEPTPKKRKMKVSVKSTFDPFEEHRHWCPWLEQTSLRSTSTSPISPQKGSPRKETFPACILALKVIAPGLMDNNRGLAHTMKTSPMVEGLRCFRRVINTWSSPKVQVENSPS